MPEQGHSGQAEEDHPERTETIPVTTNPAAGSGQATHLETMDTPATLLAKAYPTAHHLINPKDHSEEASTVQHHIIGTARTIIGCPLFSCLLLCISLYWVQDFKAGMAPNKCFIIKDSLCLIPSD